MRPITPLEIGPARSVSKELISAWIISMRERIAPGVIEEIGAVADILRILPCDVDHFIRINFVKCCPSIPDVQRVSTTTWDTFESVLFTGTSRTYHRFGIETNNLGGYSSRVTGVRSRPIEMTIHALTVDTGDF
jgi:hypothetical protein